MSAYGTSWVSTPAFDRVAREGVLFSRAFTPNAKCSPSRSIILTGRHSWQLGAAANHWPVFPEEYRTWAEVLADRVVIHFVDGQRGDSQLPADTVVADPGAPGFAPPPVVGAITGLDSPEAVGSTVTATAPFADAEVGVAAVAQRRGAAGAQDRKRARAALLPQLDVQGAGTRRRHHEQRGRPRIAPYRRPRLPAHLQERNDPRDRQSDLAPGSGCRNGRL